MANIATITNNVISALSGTTSQVLLGDATLTDFKLDSLTDVNVPTPGDGDVLRWNATTSLWEASDAAGITGSGAEGQVAYFTSANVQAGSNNLFWDATNSRLGIGTNAPTSRLYVTSPSANTTFDSGTATDARIEFRRSGTRIGYLNWDSGVVTLQADSGNYLGLNAGGSERVRILAGGNVHVGGTSDNGLRFQVTGDGYFSGSVGIGTIPSAWTTFNRILQVGNGSFVNLSGADNTFIGSNVYYGGSPFNFRYITSSVTATMYRMEAGAHRWFYAASGNAGDAITFTESMRLNANGRLLLGSTTDNGLRFQVTGDGYFSGSLGIGSTALTESSMRLGKNITGAVVAYGILNAGIIQSDVTSIAYVNRTFTQTQATAFTLNSLVHYGASQSTIGAGSAVTNQFGFFVDTSLTGATNNYAFYGNIASGTGRWNLYMNGSANNYMAGSLGIGSTSLTNRALSIIKTMTGSTDGYGILQFNTVSSGVTASAINNYSQFVTQATAFTLTNAYHYYHADISVGAGSTITNQYGYFVSSIQSATNNYGFYGNIASGTGRWNLYMAGSASNYINGSTGIGTNAPISRLTVQGDSANTDNVSGTSVQRVANFRPSNSIGALGIGFNTTTADSYIYSFYSGAALIFGVRVAPDNYEAMRIHAATRNVHIGGTSDNGLKFQVTGDGYFSGSVGIGSSSLTGYGLRLSKTITGASTAYGIRQEGTVQADVTAFALSYESNSNIAASTTLTNYVHYNVSHVSLGAGSAVTNLFGFRVNSTNTFATNNYGFYGDIASGTGRWNLYMNGTANNYLAGNLGIGITTPAGNLDVYNATSSSIYNRVGAAGANWVTTSTQSQIGTYSNIPLQIKTNDTARIYITNGGNVLVGTITDAGFKLDVNGTMRVSGASTFARITATTSSIVLDYNSGILYHFGGSGNYYQYISGADYRIANRTATGSLIFATNDTNRLTIASTGAATFSSSVTAAGLISSATEFRLNTSYTRVAIRDNGGGFAGGYNLALSGGITPIHDSTGGIAGVHYRTNGQILFYTGASQSAGTAATTRLTIDADGAATFSSSIQASTAIAIGTTPDVLFPLKVGSLMTVSSTGNVGINNTSPAHKLDVIGTSRFDGTQRIINSNNLRFTKFGIDSNAFGDIWFSSTTDSLQISSATNSIKIGGGGPTTFTEYIGIASGGSATFVSTATAASFIPTSSTAPSNGIYLPAANSVAISTNSTNRLSVSSLGIVTIANLAGSGNRLVLADSTGALSTQASDTFITSLTGEATSSGGGATTVTLTNSAVIGKLLTGLNVTSAAITASDSILSAFGKIQGQIDGLQGGTIYKGSWNASTNTPTITSGTGTQGHYYVVTTAGTTTIDGVSSWAVGDWIIFNGTVWEKIPNVDAITSVNGQTGVVNLTTSDITEGTNLYYTDARARAAISLTTIGSSGSATYSSGVLNIPTYTLAGLGGAAAATTITINGVAQDLSANRTFDVGTITSIVAGSYLTGGTITTSGTIAVDATTTNTGNKIVARDASGNFAAGTITAALTGNATTATTWQTARTITIGSTGKTVDGSANVSWSLAEIGAQAALTNPVTGTGASGQVAFWNGATTQTGSNSLFWDSTNARLGVNTASPSYNLHVTGTGYFSNNITLPNTKGVMFLNSSGVLKGLIEMDSSNFVNIANDGFVLSVAPTYIFMAGNVGVGFNSFGTNATKTVSIQNGTAPSTSVLDGFQMYSGDVTAGNAAPHFRTENGAVVKLYQETTSAGNALFLQGGGNNVLDDSTFDGYTLRQVVRALRNQGILA